MGAGERIADVVAEGNREFVSVVSRDEIDVFAQSFVTQMRPAEGCAAEEDHFVLVAAECCQDVRDGVVTPDLLLSDSEPAHDLGQVGRL